MVTDRHPRSPALFADSEMALLCVETLKFVFKDNLDLLLAYVILPDHLLRDHFGRARDQPGSINPAFQILDNAQYGRRNRAN